MRRQSLRRRLVIILLGLTTLSWLAAVALTAMYSQRIVIRQIDQLLAQYTDLAQHAFRAVRPQQELDQDVVRESRLIHSEPGLTHLRAFEAQGRGQGANFWYGSQQVVVGEHSPRFPFPEAEGAMTVQLGEGRDRKAWRILYRYDREFDIWIGRGVELDSVQELGVVTLRLMAFPLLVLLPVTLLILLWGIHRGLRPVRSLAERIAARRPHTLDPIDDSDVPREVLPVVDALNGLLVRLRRALDSEARFTSNAAHELQTPLAAIQAEVQRLQRQPVAGDNRVLLAGLLVRVNRASDTVRQLLTLARLDPDQELEGQVVDLADLVLEEMAELGGLAIDRRVDFGLSGLDAPVPVSGHREWLRILVRNLLRNALTHATPATEVEVALSGDGAGITLSLANHCEAIPPEAFLQLTDRFYRVSGGADEGVGLGLSIVQRIADLHGARLELSPWRGGQGFLAAVHFRH